VGVTLGYPSGRAGPLDRERASATDVLATADDAAMLVIDSSEQSSSRQPPTVTDTKTAAATSPTIYQKHRTKDRSHLHSPVSEGKTSREK